MQILAYSAARHNRFSSGYPSAPVANGSWMHAAYDFSGVGWLSGGQFGLTMVSAKHFLAANHARPLGTVTFFGGDGSLHNYTVADTVQVPGTDLCLGRLTATLTGGHLIKQYKVPTFAAISDLTARVVIPYGWNARAGLNTVNSSSGSTFQTLYNAETDDCQVEGGDSGSPSFIVSAADIHIVGIHSNTTSYVSGLTGSEDSTPSPYVAAINALMTGGETLTTIAITAQGQAPTQGTPGTPTVLRSLALSKPIARSSNRTWKPAGRAFR